MKNTLKDLNDHLFEQLERLNDEDLGDEQLKKELERAKGMTNLAAQIIQNGQLAFKTMAYMDENGYNTDRTAAHVPAMLVVKEDKENKK